MAWNGIIVALLFVLVGGAGAAVPVDVCVEPSFEAAVAVMRLDEHSPGFDLRPVRPAACDASDGYRARFRRRGAGVTLVLWTPTGDRLERAVPWVSRAEDAVIELARQGRLGAVAVLLSGLVLEDRALRAIAPRSPPMASDARAAPLTAGAVRADARSPATPVAVEAPRPIFERDSQEPAAGFTARRTPRPSVVGSTRAPRLVAEAARPLPTSAQSPTESGAGGTTAARALANGASRTTSPLRPPPPPEAAPFAEGDAQLGGGPGVSAPSRSPPRLETPPGARAEPRIGVGLGAALRAPTVLGLEAALRVEAWSLMLEVGGAPPLEWAFDGRPLELSAAWSAFGWAPRLWSHTAVEVDGRLALVVERLTILRLELPEAMTRAIWDAGVDLGASVSGPMDDGWRVGGLLGVRWLATANDVRIPGGPRTPLNAWQLRLALTVDWAP